MKKDSIKNKASVEIELDQTHRPFTTGRNGIFSVKRLKAWEGNNCCFIDPISQRGKVLNAGIMIEATDMDHLATVWLQLRGKYPKVKS